MLFPAGIGAANPICAETGVVAALLLKTDAVEGRVVTDGAAAETVIEGAAAAKEEAVVVAVADDENRLELSSRHVDEDVASWLIIIDLSDW